MTARAAAWRPSTWSTSATAASATCARRWSRPAATAPATPATGPCSPARASSRRRGCGGGRGRRRSGSGGPRCRWGTRCAGREAPTAVFVWNDFAAIGLIEACEAAGIPVPRDLSVVGFDDIAVAGLARISLTTVAQPLDFQAERAVEILLERMDGQAPEKPRHLTVPVELRCAGRPQRRAARLSVRFGAFQGGAADAGAVVRCGSGRVASRRKSRPGRRRVRGADRRRRRGPRGGARAPGRRPTGAGGRAVLGAARRGRDRPRPRPLTPASCARASSAGIPCFCEKPLSAEVDETVALVREVEAAGAAGAGRVHAPLRPGAA